MIFFKSLFQRPLTSSDLHSLAATNLANPPLPKDWHDLAAGIVGKNGVSLLEFWRRHFSAELSQIAAVKTWQLQRAKIFHLILTEQGWRTAFISARHRTSTSVWAHLVAEVEVFKNSAETTWEALLIQRYLVALLSEVCLIEIATKAFGYDQLKQLEVGLYESYDRQIKQLDLDINDLIHKCIDNYDDGTALELASLKDDVINPLINEQYKLLSLLHEQITYSQVDTRSFKQHLESFDLRKREIAASILKKR